MPPSTVIASGRIASSSVAAAAGSDPGRTRRIAPPFATTTGTPANASSDGPLRVIVYQKSGLSVGLVVGQIHDIIEHTLDLQSGAHGSGLLGSTVVQGHITDLVDAAAVLHAAGFTNARAA